MHIDTSLFTALPSAETDAAEAERLGYDGVWVAEVDHDPFLPLTVAARETRRVVLGTNIAVAFARNPMTLATLANDLQEFSGGRFVLGLGSQIQPHITKRFSMPWSEPAARMHELIRGIRAIWSAWAGEAPLDFRGRFYTHTLMTPFFNPGPNPHGPPPIHLAAVGPKMISTAAEVADGLLVHPFTTAAYLREITLPSVEAALASAGRDRAGFSVSVPLFVVTGSSGEEVAAAESAARMQLAFYGSTPAYRRVLEHHGWGELQSELNTLSKQGRWEEMAALIDDEVLGAFAVVAAPERLAGAVAERYAGLVDRLSFPASAHAGAPWWGDMISDLRARLAA